MNNKGFASVLVMILVVLALLIGVPCLMVVSTYNGMAADKEYVDRSYADIDTQLQRRADLIPNLVNTVKGYAAHEQGVIDSITESREKLLGAQSVEEKALADNELTKAINALMVIVENYPDLKANENFVQLTDELAGTENRIATARRDYNNAVQKYNTRIRKFPAVLIASMFGFTQAPYFEADAKSTEVPKVEF